MPWLVLPDLFVGYGSDLFAQDEIQVAEHPALASLKQKLDAIGCDASTVDGPEPTPVLIRGVERRCHIKTEPNDQEGRPEGLYGNAFGKASEDAIRKATVILDPPGITNLISIAAPYNGAGRYIRKMKFFTFSTQPTPASKRLYAHQVSYQSSYTPDTGVVVPSEATGY